MILTNPPYVTQGSAIYRKEIETIEGLRNGLELSDYYDGCGLGVEALFLKYIAGALKPGGRAFVIVPLGLLNRTDQKPKRQLLNLCNVIASIQLPPNTFFNTAQKTCILALEKRHTGKERRPPVFCAIASTIGETLDWRRLPEPDKNDLEAIAGLFVAHSGGKTVSDPRVRVVKADLFGDADRWDVTRFWDRGELIALGERDPAISRRNFIQEATAQLTGHLGALRRAERHLAKIGETGPSERIRLGNPKLFGLRSGTRITDEMIRANPGGIPVYSCFKAPEIEKGRISRDWLEKNSIPIETGRFVTVNANGASVGKVFCREAECVITDDVIIVSPLRRDIDPVYLQMKLKEAVAAGGFLYEAKLFLARVAGLEIEIPTSGNGRFNLKRQRQLAKGLKEFDEARAALVEFSHWADAATIE